MKLLLAALAAFFMLVVAASSADTFTVRLVSQTSSTITLGWDPQPGYGYLFSADGTLLSRTNDPQRSTVKFSKDFDTYEVAVIVKGATGTYPPAETPPPPPPPAAPTATFTVSPSPAVVGQPVTFDWTGSCPAGGCVVVWEDEGPDGPGGTDYPWGTSDPFTMSFAAVGTKYAHLVVTDSLGNTAESRQELTVVADGGGTDPPPPPPPPSGSCDLSATTSTFASQVGAATAGQTVCLASGNYGTWSGTSKAITVRNADGATPQMRFSFGSGAAGFTLAGMTGMGGAISGGAHDITIRDSSFTDIVNVSGSSTDAIVFDHNTHNWMVGPSTGANAKIYLENSLTGTLAAPSVTIRNSEVKNGDLDGVHFGGGSGYQIVNNVFDNLCDQNANHTDNLQFDTSPTTNVRIAGNYVHAVYSCGTQGITSYDHGTAGNVIIENNVVDIHRPWGIELYADVGTVARHNTVVYYPSSDCYFNTPCGKINVTNKSGDPVSTGTQVYDNLAVADIGSCTGCSVHHNVSSQNASYVGPTTFHDGFLLASGSVGKGAASDGTDAGVYPNGT